MSHDDQRDDDRESRRRERPRATDVLRAGAAAYDYVKSQVRGYDPKLRENLDELEGTSVGEFANAAVDGIVNGQGLPSGFAPEFDYGYEEDDERLRLSVNFLPAGLEFEDFDVDTIAGSVLVMCDVIGWQTEVETPIDSRIARTTVKPVSRDEFEVVVDLDYPEDSSTDVDAEAWESANPIEEEPSPFDEEEIVDVPGSVDGDDDEGAVDDRPQCVYCGVPLTNPGEHHFKEHAGKRYDPAWYAPHDLEEDRDGQS